MEYGAHDKLVREVIDFVNHGPLLVAAEAPEVWSSSKIIRELADAKALAWNQIGPDEGLNWVDLREFVMSEIMEERYRLRDFEMTDRSLSLLLDEFYVVLRRRLAPSQIDLLDDVVGDLYNCAFARAVVGNGCGFLERMFAIYQSGGWPCGWEGTFPEGSFVVFLAPEKIRKTREGENRKPG